MPRSSQSLEAVRPNSNRMRFLLLGFGHFGFLRQFKTRVRRVVSSQVEARLVFV